MVLAWEYLQEVFVTLVVISFLILVFILFPGYFTMSRALHPSFSGPWRTPPALSSTLTTFDCFFLFIYRKSYGFEWAFFFHRRFLTYVPSQNFWYNLLLSRPPWEPAVGLHTDTQNTDPAHLFVWFTVTPNPLYILNLYLYVSILQKVSLVVKTLIKKYHFFGSEQPWKHKAAATLISNHKNMKQQPH